MRPHTLYRRSLGYHWRAALAVALGVVAGTATLTGALLVGDAMRGSLRAAALERLGRIDGALRAPRFVRAALADEIAADLGVEACPAMLVRGSATHADSRRTVQRLNVLGLDDRFWKLGEASSPPPFAGRVVVLNAPLAEELGAAPGDDVLLRIGKPGLVSTEMLLGRRDDTTLTLRLQVHAIAPATGLGAFGLEPQQTLPRNAYVPLAMLQRALDQADRANALLVAGEGDMAELNAALLRRLTLADLGLRLRIAEPYGYVALESGAFVIEPPFESTARAAAAELDTPTAGVLAYLANTIAVASRPDEAIPYSTVAALEATDALRLVDGTPLPPLATDEIALNEWAARDLHAEVGDRLQLSYYVTDAFGQLRTETSAFRLSGIVQLDGAAADPGFTPEYPGMTDTQSVADWDPPFPIDLNRIRERDEDYWDKYRTAPKAFVSLAHGQQLWADQPDRLGRLTSIRIHPRAGDSVAATATAFERAFLTHAHPAKAGLQFEAVRARALVASEGTTDFGGLFIGFSFFLIISAAMLVALLYRLGVERRASEVGLLLALGFTPARVARLFLVEGVVLAALGAAVGLVVARGYAWLMVAGLRSWWSDAVRAPFLQLHDSPTSYLIGYGVSVLVAAAAIAWALRGLTRCPPQRLLAGAFQSGRPPRRRRSGTTAAALALLGLGAAGVLIGTTLLTDAVSQSVAFFCSGTALLVACVAGLARWLRIESRAVVRTGGFMATLRLGIRNARRHVGRSVLTAGLIAFATFEITSLHAMRLEPPAQPEVKESGTGGFTLMAEAAVPLVYDLSTPAGRAALGLSPQAEDELANSEVIALRLRAGDETSCRNLYRPTRPRLLGAPDAMIERGGFKFSATLAQAATERDNPWTLLHKHFPDDAIPVIADEAAVLWQLHSSLGGDLSVIDERGREARLRIAALLKGSCLQGELIIAEEKFRTLFPSIAGYALFLVATPSQKAAAVEQTLERELADFGVGAMSTRTRLAELQAVQNTYLSTFQTLGGLGLLLGTVGLAVVLLRNVWERRSELALLQALGFSRIALGWLVLSENAFLVAAGLLAGLLPAAVVVAPHVVGRGATLPWGSLLLTFAAIFAAGVLAGLAALIPALRAKLLPALRSE